MFTSLYSSHASARADVTLCSTLFCLCVAFIITAGVQLSDSRYDTVGRFTINCAATVNVVTMTSPAMAMLIAWSIAFVSCSLCIVSYHFIILLVLGFENRIASAIQNTGVSVFISGHCVLECMQGSDTEKGKIMVCFLPSSSELLEKSVLNSIRQQNSPPQITTTVNPWSMRTVFPTASSNEAVLGHSCGIHYGGKVFMHQSLQKRNYKVQNNSVSKAQHAKLRILQISGEWEINYTGYYAPCSLMPRRQHTGTTDQWTVLVLPELVSSALEYAGLIEQGGDSHTHPDRLYENIKDISQADCASLTTTVLDLWHPPIIFVTVSGTARSKTTTMLIFPVNPNYTSPACRIMDVLDQSFLGEFDSALIVISCSLCMGTAYFFPIQAYSSSTKIAYASQFEIRATDNNRSSQDCLSR